MSEDSNNVEKADIAARKVPLANQARGGFDTRQADPSKVRGQSSATRDMTGLARNGGRSGDDNQSSGQTVLRSSRTPQQEEGTSSSYSSGKAPVKPQEGDQSPSGTYSSSNPMPKQEQDSGPSDSYESRNGIGGR